MKRTILILCYCFVHTLAFGATVTWDGTGDGINWSDDNNWEGGSQPTSSDDVLIDGFDVTLDISTTVQRVYLLGSSMLTIDASSVLTIDGFTGNDEGFEVNNSATVINDGTINVSTINGGTGADGIYVRGTFTNNGVIAISNIGQHGLYVQRGNFTNGVGGAISITNTGTLNSDGDGLYVDDSSGILGLLTNNGTITITTTSGDDGIYVNDGSSLVNLGTITVSGGDNGIRLDDSGVFTNEEDGVVNVDGGTDDQIYVDNVGAVFNNSGTINLTNADSDDAALYVIDEGTFNNLLGGVVNITNALQYAVQVDANSASAEIINSGTINVTGGNNDALRIQEDGLFTNNASGLLNFVSAGDEAIQIDNPGTVNNMGSIVIDTPTDHGMELLGTFENSGTITIDDAADNGIYLTNAGIFNNNSGGSINITNTEDHAIQLDANSNATPATLSNTGTITLTSSIDHSFRLQEDAVFTNNAGGLLNIVSASRKGILLETNAVLNNSGTIDIPGAAEEGMDMIEGTFNNMVGGIYRATDTVDDGLEINGPSVFNNDGILDIDGSLGEDIEVLYGPSFEIPTINNSSSATLNPGSSPGDFTIKGDFDFGSMAITFEINGLVDSLEYDQIRNFSSSNFVSLSTSTAHLDWGTFVPEVGDKFKIIDGSGLTLGSFADVTSSLPQLVYTTTNLGTEIEVEITEILPVELVQFTAKKVDKGSLLSWQTANEINNDGFEIERSHNATDWTTIGFERGQGDSQRLETYSYFDNEPSAGINYYRLKQNDIDGNFVYSNIVSLEFEKDKIEYSLYPNPVKDILYMDIDEEMENVEIKLYDAMGKVVWTQKGAIKQISFEHYKSGIYFLEISNSLYRSIQKITK